MGAEFVADDIPFASAWDAALYTSGPPSVFTLDPKGWFRVDPERTRECELIVGIPAGRSSGTWVLTDRTTNVRMVIVVTHEAFATCQPRGDVEHFATLASARAHTMEQWRVAGAEPDSGAGDEA